MQGLKSGTASKLKTHWHTGMRIAHDGALDHCIQSSLD